MIILRLFIYSAVVQITFLVHLFAWINGNTFNFVGWSKDGWGGGLIDLVKSP